MSLLRTKSAIINLMGWLKWGQDLPWKMTVTVQNNVTKHNERKPKGFCDIRPEKNYYLILIQLVWAGGFYVLFLGNSLKRYFIARQYNFTQTIIWKKIRKPCFITLFIIDRRFAILKSNYKAVFNISQIASEKVFHQSVFFFFILADFFRGRWGWESNN